ncbi:MAG TPA: hypothetical protein VJ302_32000, partial [Blastocatellia bacterium]|nr:hypothetical protein [Blastocatellia bacterium]
GNYLAGGAPLIMSEWFDVIADDNTLIGQGTLAAVRMPVGALPSTYSWDNNTYYTNNSTAASPFIFETAEKSSSYNFADWQKVTGFDHQGRQFRSATAKPSGVKVIIRPNLFEAGRAHLAVYNWDNSSEVEVNLKDFLPNGARYEIRNVYDYFGAPVSSNLYDGKPIRLPMGNTKTGPEFNAFVLTVINSRNLKPRNTRFIN